MKNFLLVFAALSPLLLTSCGDGWVVQPYKGVPYDGRGIDDDERTAGYGVEYVRAKMMPAKGTDSRTLTPVQVKTAEPVFDKAQRK